MELLSEKQGREIDLLWSSPDSIRAIHRLLSKRDTQVKPAYDVI